MLILSTIKTLSSVIHGLLNWDLLFWPRAMPQPGKKFNFDHEYQVGYIPCSDCPNAFWKLQWLGPTLWQKSSQVKHNPANLKTWCFPIISYRGSPVLPSQQRQRCRNGGLCLPCGPPPSQVPRGVCPGFIWQAALCLPFPSARNWEWEFLDFLLQNVSALCQTGLDNGLIKSDLS